MPWILHESTPVWVQHGSQQMLEAPNCYLTAREALAAAMAPPKPFIDLNNLKRDKKK